MPALDFDVAIDLQLADDLPADCHLPTEAQVSSWAQAALGHYGKDSELSIRLVGNDESQQLNRDYRGKDKPTNVLSFPADFPEELNIPLLGDIIICAPVIAAEALEQGKEVDAHWAHMVVHGTLHLLGYDHIDDSEAEEMEALETQILQQLGYPAPYESQN